MSVVSAHPDDLICNLTSVKALFPSIVHYEVLGLGLRHEFWAGEGRDII